MAPLTLASQAGVREHSLASRFMIEGTLVIMDVFNLATLPVERPGQPVTALADEDPGQG